MNPLLLAGVALVAIPIVLHFVMRHKPKRIEFPALRLVQRRQKASKRRLQLRHLLLLALRIGLLALLAFALARPSMKFSGRFGSQESPVAAALVFDTSIRMDYRQANQTRLEKAVELGEWLLQQFPHESQIAVVDSRSGPVAFQVDRSAADQRVERLEITAASAGLLDRIGQAVELLAGDDLARKLARKEVYVFTDLSKSAWSETALKQLRQAIEAVPEGINLYLIDVGVTNPADYRLDSLRLSDQVLATEEPVQIQATFARVGTGGEREIELYLFDKDKKPVRRGQKIVQVSKNDAVTIDFTLGSLQPGVNQGFLKIVGQDALEIDNQLYFSVDVKRPWHILVVDPGKTHTYPRFFTETLSPESFRRQGQVRFDCKTIIEKKLPETDLENYDAVCLLDPTPLGPETWQRLTEYVRAGHGLAIFLGRNAQPIDSFNKAAAQELLPGTLVRQAKAPPGGNLHLAPRTYGHPMLQVFQEFGDTVPWADTTVQRYWQLGKPAKGTNVVVPYLDGRPAILERTVGSGRVLTMTTPVSDVTNREPWNLLPTPEAWPFFILTHRMMLYLVGATDIQLNYLAGQTAIIPIDRNQKYNSYLLTLPDGKGLPIGIVPRQSYLSVPTTEQPGNYRLGAGGRSGVSLGFSVNLTRQSTDLARVTPEYLKKHLEPVPFTIARDQFEIHRDVQTARVGREFFTMLIIIVALIMAAEHFVANRFYKE
ncbi:MAG: BatA domain-containing protein [Planctomycetia bacterium]